MKANASPTKQLEVVSLLRSHLLLTTLTFAAVSSATAIVVISALPPDVPSKPPAEIRSFAAAEHAEDVVATGTQAAAVEASRATETPEVDKINSSWNVATRGDKFSGPNDEKRVEATLSPTPSPQQIAFTSPEDTAGDIATIPFDPPALPVDVGTILLAPARPSEATLPVEPRSLWRGDDRIFFIQPLHAALGIQNLIGHKTTPQNGGLETFVEETPAADRSAKRAGEATTASNSKNLEAADSPAPEPPRKTWFNAMLFREMPPEVRQNPSFPTLRVIYGTEIWGPGQSNHEPLEANIRRIAFSVEPKGLICYDIEHWHLDPKDPEEFDSNTRKFHQIIDWTRDERPDVRIGFYGLFPALHPRVAILPEDDPRRIAAKHRLTLLEPLIERVDVLFPTLYTVMTFEQLDVWSGWFRLMLEEAARIAPDKPTYPFLWFDYHGGILAERAGEPLENEFWAMQLETAAELADGAVIWGGYKKTWEDSAPWWITLREHLSPPTPRSTSYD